MTYSELLHSVKFDDLVPYIIKYHGDEECVAWYKIHYDMLCRIIPHRDADIDEDGNDITSATISYCELDEKEKTEHKLLDAYPLEGDLWEVSLAKDLIIAPNVKASKEEIAACCLWHTSFHGFTPIQREYFFREEDGVDAEETKRYKEMYRNMIPSIKQMLQNKSFHKMVRGEMKYFRTKPKKWEKFCYAKRCWWKWKRIIIEDEYNRIISNIGEFIEMLHQGENIVAPPSVEELCKKLFWGKHCNNLSYQTYINDATKRCEYFKELIVKYKAFTYARLPGAVVCLSSSSDYPVTVEEMELISLATQGCEEVQFCVKVDDNLARELMIRVAFYEQ